MPVNQNEPGFREKRRHDRFVEGLRNEERVVIKSRENHVAAKLVNLSFGGALLEVRTPIPNDASFGFAELIFNNGGLPLVLNARKARTDGLLVGFEFGELSAIEKREIDKKLFRMQALVRAL